MKGATHMVAGAITGLATAHIGQAPEAALPLMIAGSLGSLIPDIDMASSKLGRRIWPAALLVQIFIGHRTLFHAPLLYAGLWFLLKSLIPQYSLIITAAFVGIASHILLDLFNPAGIPLLYPIPKRFHLGNMRSGGLIDWLLCLFLLATLALIIAKGTLQLF